MHSIEGEGCITVEILFNLPKGRISCWPRSGKFVLRTRMNLADDKSEVSDGKVKTDNFCEAKKFMVNGGASIGGTRIIVVLHVVLIDRDDWGNEYLVSISILSATWEGRMCECGAGNAIPSDTSRAFSPLDWYYSPSFFLLFFFKLKSLQRC